MTEQRSVINEMVEVGARAIANGVNSPGCSQFETCGQGGECYCRTNARLAITAALALNGLFRDCAELRRLALDERVSSDAIGMRVRNLIAGASGEKTLEGKT